MYIFTNSATLVIVCLCCHPACPYIVLRPAPCVCVCVCVCTGGSRPSMQQALLRALSAAAPTSTSLCQPGCCQARFCQPCSHTQCATVCMWPGSASHRQLTAAVVVCARCAVVLSRCAALCGAVPQRQARQHTLFDSHAAVGYLSGERTSIWRRDLATIMLGPGPEEVSTGCLRVCGVASAVGPERMGLRCLLLYARSIWPGCGGGWVSGSRRRASWPRRGLTTR